MSPAISTYPTVHCPHRLCLAVGILCSEVLGFMLLEVFLELNLGKEVVILGELCLVCRVVDSQTETQIDAFFGLQDLKELVSLGLVFL